jgi:hypothetical protein
MFPMTRSLLLALALLLPSSALADGDAKEPPKTEESASVEPAKKNKVPTPAEQLRQLRGERTEILDELGALEEGYSELVNHDARALEARVEALLTRLRVLDERIASLGKGG